MQIWDYDRSTGVLLGRSAADPDPGEPGAWLIPAYATKIRPPFVPEGCVAIFNGGLSAIGEWRIELAAGQLSGLGLNERAALSTLINSYVGDHGDQDNARSSVMEAAEDVLERANMPDMSPADQTFVRDQVRAFLHTLLYGMRGN